MASDMVYGVMEPATMVREVTRPHMERVYRNIAMNDRVQTYYWRMGYTAVRNKELPAAMVKSIGRRSNHIGTCNQFWRTVTYEANHVKVLEGTCRCKDKFCHNCNQANKMVRKSRYLPHLEPFQDSLYHMTLTVPNCCGVDLRETVRLMSRCFKTLVTYLNGNKKVRGIDLMQYGFQGCIRTLEITYKKDSYHPHFHVVAVLGNGDGLERKHIHSQFSGAGNRLFSDFEIIIQRMWWLLMNRKSLTADNILGEGSGLGRYSCVIDKCQPNDFESLFGYVAKTYSADNKPMTYENFKRLFLALEGVRQIQPYGVFYGTTKALDTVDYTAQELRDYLACDEQPIRANEWWGRLVYDNKYTVLRTKYRPRKV